MKIFFQIKIKQKTKILKIKKWYLNENDIIFIENFQVIFFQIRIKIRELFVSHFLYTLKQIRRFQGKIKTLFN